MNICRIFLSSIMIGGSCILLPVGAAQNISPPKDAIPIVNGKTPLARIVASDKLDENLKKATECLRDYILKSTGVELEIQNKKSETLANIYIGLDPYSKSGDIGFSDREEFAIFFPDDKDIVLAGGSPAGTEYAIYEFLERYIGVRWLFPGELGEHVPKHENVSIPRETIRQSPTFLLRHFFCISEKAQRDWVRRMRINCNDRLQFHHNLGNIFTADLFGKTHPEFFPYRRDGKRFIPPRGSYSWQPCFSAKGSADAAAKRIRDFFAAHPEAVSYSLGVNDNVGHCRCEQCLAKVPADKNEIGLSNYSQLYYQWTNEVIAKVRQEYPDRYFGCLAYNSVFSPPTKIKLDEHFVPMITFDFYQWVDENTKKKIKHFNQEWQKSADILGWCDYLYGGKYEMPRIWFRAMTEYLRYAHKHNVKYYAAEAPQKFDWREGPKLYLAAKLLWNPNQEPDEILSEWYGLAVGEKAAPYMKQYFEFLEHLWCSRIPKTSWFKTGAGKIYLDFESSGYLDAVNENDIAKCDEFLRLMLANPGAPRQQQRANHYYDTFKNWSGNIRKYLQQDAVDAMNLVSEDSFSADKNFWRVHGGSITRDDTANMFCSGKNSYLILSGDINIEGIIAELRGRTLEIELKAKGVGNPFFGACIFGLDKDKKYIDNENCRAYVFWNVSLREQMTSLKEQVKLDTFINDRYLEKIKYLRIIFYNISSKDKPDSRIFIEDVSVRAKGYESAKTDYELIRNGNFAAGSDLWGISQGGAIVAANGGYLFKAPKDKYIILRQGINEDNLMDILSKYPTWQVKINARGENNPRIGMIIANPKVLPLNPRNIFWDVQLNNETTEIKRDINIDFITETGDCTRLLILIYRCDHKNNPSGQVYIENVSMSPVKQ